MSISELIHKYNKKSHFIFDPIQRQETNWNFIGCQVPHFMIVFIPYINLLKPFLDKKKYIYFCWQQ